MTEHDIILTYGSDAKGMTTTLLQHIDLSKLLPDRNATIVLKPNLVVPSRPQEGATTHPEICTAIIEHIKALGYCNLKIVESAWIGASTKEGFSVNGYDRISRTYDVPLVDVKDDKYINKSVDGITMEVSKTVLECDFLINLPVLKGHCQTLMTCALKNMKGALSDRSKRLFHTLGLHHPIAALNKVRPADLVIVDSINGDLDFEEGGTPIQTNRMFACWDSVLCDAFAASLLGFSTEDIPYIGMAECLGVGSADLSKAQILQLNEPVADSPSRPSKAVSYLANHTEARSACSACYGNLIHALKRLDGVNRLGEVRQTICIGQDFKSVQDATKVGVGSCTRLLGKSLPGCPPTAIEMLEFIKNLNQ